MENTIAPKGYAGDIPVHCSYDKIVTANELQPNPMNPNQHPEDQIELLAKVIAARGWRAPVTVSTRSGLIVRGHGRLEAALRLGCSVPVDYQDYASDDDELADLLADNKLTELAEIDDQKLAEIFACIDMDIIKDGLTGFSADEVDKITEAFLYTGVSPDDFGDDFSLNNADAPLFRTMTFHFDEEQYAAVNAAFAIVKQTGITKETGSSNENGICLYKVVTEWAELKKLSLK